MTIQSSTQRDARKISKKESRRGGPAAGRFVHRRPSLCHLAVRCDTWRSRPASAVLLRQHWCPRSDASVQAQPRSVPDFSLSHTSPSLPRLSQSPHTTTATVTPLDPLRPHTRSPPLAARLGRHARAPVLRPRTQSVWLRVYSPSISFVELSCTKRRRLDHPGNVTARAVLSVRSLLRRSVLSPPGRL